MPKCFLHFSFPFEFPRVDDWKFLYAAVADGLVVSNVKADVFVVSFVGYFFVPDNYGSYFGFWNFVPT